MNNQIPIQNVHNLIVVSVIRYPLLGVQSVGISVINVVSSLHWSKACLKTTKRILYPEVLSADQPPRLTDVD